MSARVSPRIRHLRPQRLGHARRRIDAFGVRTPCGVASVGFSSDPAGSQPSPASSSAVPLPCGRADYRFPATRRFRRGGRCLVQGLPGAQDLLPTFFNEIKEKSANEWLSTTEAWFSTAMAVAIHCLSTSLSTAHRLLSSAGTPTSVSAMFSADPALRPAALPQRRRRRTRSPSTPRSARDSMGLSQN